MYAQIAQSINQLVSEENANKKKTLVEWTVECQQAFKKLKQLCNETSILAYATIGSLSNYIQMLVRMD